MTVWLPLKADRTIINQYMHLLGVPEGFTLADVFDLDEPTVEYTSSPVKAVILLYQFPGACTTHFATPLVTNQSVQFPPDLFFMNQITFNNCSTVAMIHCIANNKDIKLGPGVLTNFLENTKGCSPEVLAQALASNSTLFTMHQQFNKEHQYSLNPEYCHHYVAFVHHKGALYELDGRKRGPIQHGATNAESFLKDAAKVCKQFKMHAPGICFHMLALIAEE